MNGLLADSIWYPQVEAYGETYFSIPWFYKDV